MPDLRAQAGLLIKGVAAKASEVFDEQGELAQIVVPSFFKVRTDDAAQYNVTGLSGPGVLSKRTEQGSYDSGRRYKTYDTNFIHTTYSKELEVSMEQMQDRDFDSVWDEIKQLRKAADYWRQSAVFQAFNGAFVTTSATNGVDLTRYGDGVALCSTAHPRADGGASQSNASSTGIPLNEANLETAIIALKKQLLDDGTPIRDLGRMTLVVPTELEKTAKIILQSTQRSNTANNDINIYKDGMYDLVATHLLSSTTGRAGGSTGSNTAWFLVAENLSKLMLVDRLAPTLTTEKAEHGGMKFKVDTRLSVGHAHWLGVYGSKGDNTSYSG